MGLPISVNLRVSFAHHQKKTEVIELYTKHPDLFNRAVAVENQAELTTIKGLGRNYSWKNLVELHLQNQPLPNVGFELPCECTE